MRTLILIIFTVMCLGTINAQNTIEIHDVVYQVVHDNSQPRQINQVWGETVPMRISFITRTDIIINTNIPDLDAFTHHHRRGQLNRTETTPQLRWYENGGNQRQALATGSDVFIPLEGLNTLSMYWYWRNTDSYGVSRPIKIGEYHATR